MQKLALKVKKRDKANSLKTLRTKGFLPAVFYGRKEKSTPIFVSAHDFKEIWKKAGESAIVSLHGAGKDIDAVIHDVQVHPVTDEPRHADFYVIEKDRKIKVSIPLEFTGESPAEKLGHILVKVLHEIEVEALPGNLPQSVRVDISPLVELDSQILVKDIKMPEGVKATLDKEEVVISVSEAREDEPEPELEEVDMDAIEVEAKGKEEEEGTEEEKSAPTEAPAGKGNSSADEKRKKS